METSGTLAHRTDGITALDKGVAGVPEASFGRRAAKLARMSALGLPIAPGVALSFDLVRRLGEGEAFPDLPGMIASDAPLVLRLSPLQRGLGGPGGLANIGLGSATVEILSRQIGAARAWGRYVRLIIDFAALVHDVDLSPIAGVQPGDDTVLLADPAIVERLLDQCANLTGTTFPNERTAQLAAATAAVVRVWNSRTARLVRLAKGAPEDAGLGLILQTMHSGNAAGNGGTGVFEQVDPANGTPGRFGTFRPFRTAIFPADGTPASVEPQSETDLCDLEPGILDQLDAAAKCMTRELGDACRIEFVLHGLDLTILDAMPVRRNARSAVRIAVDLVHQGAISRERAILQIEPKSLIEYLHPQVAPDATRDVIALGLAASPGAATGKIAFTAEEAQTAAARGEHAVLVRLETSPEDIRGMHSAAAVLTVRGGMTSHAAVIARGMGVPCVVGASDLRIDLAGRQLLAADGRAFAADDTITLDGTTGEVIAGTVDMIAPELTGALSELLAWADDARTIGVRANADTPAEARAARDFGVDGIGLCRTENMFFDASRITTMREMILADSVPKRQEALNRLLPMQRADFVEMFGIMRGLPVTIRLLDPPLHEFLPTSVDEITEFAHSMGLPVAQVTARARELSEVNPMLGMRGVRLGVVMPEIYEMQARAIFEAAVEVNRGTTAPVVPEVMVPLVSAYRESELIKDRVDAVAADVRREQGVAFEYRLGIMVETPRAALRAGDLAATSAFLSFGTNDLTQMTYGLSRDDAGRFMREYVNKGVFDEDPFLSLDVEGVGELLLIASRRGRARNPRLTLGLCGEHGGDPSSIRFCRLAGFDYVSCSPFRVPIARLAAAQASLLANAGAQQGVGEGLT